MLEEAEKFASPLNF